MALMVCPDCGAHISDTAELCIHCGCDLFLYKEELRIDKEIEEKMIEYEQSRKPPKQVESLSEVSRYRNTDTANAIMLGFACICFIFSALILLGGEDIVLFFIMAIPGIICMVSYYVMNKDAKKLLHEEQQRIQHVIDNFEEVKRRDVEAHREYLLRSKYSQLEKIKNRNTKPVPERPKGLRCPVCDSTYCEKITTFDRVVSVELVGVASGKIGKQYKCKNCGHMW